jgi:hypothetical protein
MSTWCGKCNKLLSHIGIGIQSIPGKDEWCSCKEPDYESNMVALHNMVEEGLDKEKPCEHCNTFGVDRETGFCVCCGQVRETENK